MDVKRSNEIDGRVRGAMVNEVVPPTHGDWGGPLCCIIAKYEDGTEISFGHEVMNKLTRTRPDPAEVERLIVDIINWAGDVATLSTESSKYYQAIDELDKARSELLKLVIQ